MLKKIKSIKIKRVNRGLVIIFFIIILAIIILTYTYKENYSLRIFFKGKLAKNKIGKYLILRKAEIS